MSASCGLLITLCLQDRSYAEYAYYHGLIPLGVKTEAERLYDECFERVKIVVGK